jgi:ATP-dependent Clp protease ATP-binding subunit ClpB
MQIEIEVEAIKARKGRVKLKSLRNNDLSNLKEERNELNAQWEMKNSLITFRMQLDVKT